MYDKYKCPTEDDVRTWFGPDIRRSVPGLFSQEVKILHSTFLSYLPPRNGHPWNLSIFLGNNLVEDDVEISSIFPKFLIDGQDAN